MSRMTVKELIAKLQEADPDVFVVEEHWEDSGCSCGTYVSQYLESVYDAGSEFQLSMSEYA